jgi:phenylalanine-4-hydroxylase
MYTPEPDVCHELLGHVPLFADPEFADFSQEIGLASLGATDKDIEKLATVYWFTVEFGLCKENGVMKAYGAGLLSSFGELEYCLSDRPKKEAFNPEMTSLTKYPITMYQPLYYYTESFEDAKRKVKDFASTLDRPFTVRYNAVTETVEILDKQSSISSFSKQIRNDMATLTEAIDKLIL